ncbi:30S ribosomal protein S4 [Candidatus Nardonella dryophthoridicola]|uniref:Small ribosomal subunit protein uS4 n=1 Tax=endosymbiont of Rhynchophorus ferrugineus TaxID=1972133 RepID=A0A2Z5TPX3_9GAMM|nr:30S ribosomal protein S4 [Candidatus Nardonella dryophthoridicola]BBA85114.1 30S ribosomal protein S4 [endosymbiont of Rhynchophorus ferrugineus]
MSKYIGPKIKIYKKIGIYLNKKIKSKNLTKKYKKKNINYKNKVTEYCIRLKEKQKLKKNYYLFEKQFFNYYKKSIKYKNSEEKLFQLLEMRLDNIVSKIGISKTILGSRQFINHKFILINNKIVNIPSYILKVNDVITIHNKFKLNNSFNMLLKSYNKNINWININIKNNNFSAEIISIPKVTDINKNINFNLIRELYSK